SGSSARRRRWPARRARYRPRMLDPRRLRTELDALKAGLARRDVEPSELDRAAALDERQRQLASRRDEVRARIKALSKEVGQAKRDGDEARATALAGESRALGDEEKEFDTQAAAAAAELRNILLRTPNLPADEAPDDGHAERDDLWATPTAEAPLPSLHRDEILDEADLPVRLMASTSCFRREAGSAGRDTRGLLRVHEFDKVEILAYCTPEQAADVHADLLARAEGAMQALGLAYRVVDLCAGDLGDSSRRTFDLEVYAPG